MIEGSIRKEYREDVAGPDDGDYDYRWWEYTFDFDGVRYRARVYVDEPTCAYVVQLTDVRSDDPDRLHVLAFIQKELAAEGVVELAVSEEGAYQAVPRQT